jgi:ubiquinone/menaquinone biosynthesis C-methylase UbiE
MEDDYNNFDFLEKLFDDIQKEKARKILNVACGRELKSNFSKNLKASFYGIDIDSDVVGGNVKFCDIDREKLPFGGSSFDVVICIFGVEHFKNPENLFSEANRVLKSNGKFIFVTSNANNPVFLFNRIFSLRKFYFNLVLHREESYKNYYRCNTISRITNLSNQNNFKVEEIIVFGNLSSYVEDFKNFTKKIVKSLEVFEKILYRFNNNSRPRIYASLRK